ncbi:MAG TPA: glycosyltransferase family 2 protein [Myxococcota bacterium]|nr:glycosyltransferase family 2 protein [Myxococcota bacterium]
MSAPAVSVLMPVRDAEATLAAALRSVERQTERCFECIVVDDGSRDESLALAREQAARDPRFRVIAAPRAGLVEALRAGLAACLAPLVARMDADDWMHRERLAAQRAALEADATLSGVGCHVRCFPRRELGSGLRDYEAWLASIDSPWRVRQEAFVECPLAHPTWMLRREALIRFGYHDAGWPEDYDLLLRLLAAGRLVGVVPRRLLGWRIHARRLSRTSDTYSRARFTACKAAHLAAGLLAGSERYALWGYGATGRALARALEAHGRRADAIVEIHPRRIGRTIRGAPVISRHALGPPSGRPLVVSVAGASARALIRAELARMGWRECVDFVCAA